MRGGVKSSGAMPPAATPLVDLLKNLRSICGETVPSDGGRSATASVSSAAGTEAGAGAAGMGSVILPVFSAGGGTGGCAGTGGGGTTLLVMGLKAGRKRNGAGPTAGK